MSTNTQSASLLGDRYCLMPHNGIFAGKAFRRDTAPASHLKSHVQLSSSAKPLSPSGRGNRSRGLPLQQSNISWLQAIIPKPPYSLLSLAFITSRSSGSSTAFHSTHTACIDTACWQLLLPVVCEQSVYCPAKRRISVAMTTSAYLQSEWNYTFFVP